MQPGKPKLGRPGDPGVIKVGGDHHGGYGYLNAVADDYPLKFGLRTTDIPDSSKVPPRFRVKRVK